MENINLEYLCESLGTLCGMPVRLFVNKKLSFYHSPVNIPKDPFILVEDILLQLTDEVGYYSTKDFFYYGYINNKENMIVIGPSRLITADDNTLNRQAMLLGLNKQEHDVFINSMKSIITMPLDSLIQSLATFSYVLNGNIINTKDILVHADNIFFNKQDQYYNASQSSEENELHNTYDIEQIICNMITNGDLVTFNSIEKKATSIRPGVLSKNYLRQIKNIFIVTATLASRAAIKGGLEVNVAMSLSDSYIQKCELLSNEADINTLSYQMIKDYTKRVNKIKHPSEFVQIINRYIYNHISEMILIDDLANELYISRSTLCNKFKKIEGISINEYIQKVKINEAKELLMKKNLNILSISQYLGYSSQSHFNKAFKDQCGITPKKYQMNCIKAK